MIVVDTSAWIEYQRATESAADLLLTKLVSEQAELGIPDVVRLELLAGARDQAQLVALQALLARFSHVPAHSPHDHDIAAGLFRAARAQGQTVRSHVDCLVAAVAIRLDVPVLAQDRDFDLIAQVSSLRLA